MAKSTKQQPATTTTSAAPAPAAAPIMHVVMGPRQYKPRVTASSKHDAMGDVVMFAKVQAALAGAPTGIPVAQALALVKSVNPKNGAYLGYAIKHQWLALVPAPQA